MRTPACSALAVALTLAVAASCGGQARKSAATAPSAVQEGPAANPDSAPEGADDPAAQINQLADQITELRTRMGAGESTDEICEGLTECTDACNLAESICTNADKICELATEVSDPWALEKCEGAKTSCTDAKAVCTCCVQKLQ